MEKNVFITKTGSYFPNNAVTNDEIEEFIGMINNKHSRAMNIVLRQNGIKTRYYALDKNQNITHTNSELAANSIHKMIPDEKERNEVEVLVCGTSTPDQLLPSHASMVHGATFKHPIEIFSLSGVCMSAIAALKTAYMSIKSGNSNNAICSTSELVSPILLSKFFEKEYNSLKQLEDNPTIAFNKDFLRFMLSDGAGCCYLKSVPAKGLSMKIEWIETVSYANSYPTCMYQWADIDNNGHLKGWKEYEIEEIAENSVWCIKQDVKLLNKHVIQLFVDAIDTAIKKHRTDTSTINYIIPHISSMYFYNRLSDELIKRGINLPTSKWFTNLTTVGNIGSASIFAALDELARSKCLKQDDKILLLVPESGRFVYGVVLLSVLYS